ncbi:hypothetical protein DFP72DRAFT_855929 [Ephemerocybe angulata]|uniref:Uncharacterized protein n=1 Tax=Ephemerocybe angulata TaxID=980116 RepID=A0A8H6HF86_9AGAR|nr:hypothetical protein DFP72DRAFT_855929 [Tulosesus angulatus]
MAGGAVDAGSEERLFGLPNTLVGDETFEQMRMRPRELGRRGVALVHDCKSQQIRYWDGFSGVYSSSDLQYNLILPPNVISTEWNRKRRHALTGPHSGMASLLYAGDKQHATPPSTKAYHATNGFPASGQG